MTQNQIKVTRQFAIQDGYSKQVRNGFVANDPFSVAIQFASEVVDVSHYGGEDTYAEYFDKELSIVDAYRILSTHNSRIVEIPGYMADLIREEPGYVVADDKEAFFDGSLIGVTVVDI